MKTQTDNKILSPFQNENHPVRNEIRKFCGTFDIQVNFEEDISTINSFPHIPGLVAFICTLKKDGQLIALGRSCAVFSRLNKYLERTISSAVNGSFLSAANNATKVIEALRISDGLMPEGDHKAQYSEYEDLATEKQKTYLESLIANNINSVSEREKWQRDLNSGLMTRYEASKRINALLDPQ